MSGETPRRLLQEQLIDTIGRLVPAEAFHAAHRACAWCEHEAIAAASGEDWYSWWRLAGYCEGFAHSVCMFGERVATGPGTTSLSPTGRYRSMTERLVSENYADDMKTMVLASLSPCVWREDEDGCWLTGCGKLWSFDGAGTPEDHGCSFCHHCGHPLQAVAYLVGDQYDEEDDEQQGE